jgi:ABC-type polysaccharide/polyol phosphate transport system ATPase subunit
MSSIAEIDRLQDYAVILDNITVEYNLPEERVGTFKEYIIRIMQGKIRFRKLLALNDISLSIKQGEIFGILGRNGAGKTTLLKVLSRVLDPKSGRVWINGGVHPLLQLGAGFHQELTGLENVFLNGTILGHSRKEIEEKLPQIIDFSEIGDFIHAPIRTYSSGMLARLGFSVATAWIPDILILDEVLSVGDAAFVQKCSNRMKVIQDSGATILLVSHSIELVESLCQRAMLLDHGKLLEIGPVKDVCQTYNQMIFGES